MAAVSWIHQSHWTWSGIALAATGTLVIATLLYLLPNALFFGRRSVRVRLKVARQMRKQGYSGPPFTCLTDNFKEIQEMMAKAESQPLQSITHDFHSRIFPHIHAWKNLYGQRLIFSPGGGVTVMNTADPRVIKEVFLDTATYEKSIHNKAMIDILGSTGLVFSHHEEWAKQRHVLSPKFHPSRSREIVTEMASWIGPWLDRLETLVVDNGGAVDKDITNDVGEVVKDILARSSFGSSFAQGKKVFDNQLQLIQLLSQTAFTPRVIRFLSASLNRSLPTPLNRKIWKAKREVAKSLQELIQARRDSVKAARNGFFGNDLLGVLLSATENQKSPQEKWTDKNLMDQCKTFYSSGTDTVQLVLKWAIMLIAYYHDWQERIRAEVKTVFKNAPPDGKKLAQLKSLHMFVDETLRLYPPAPQLHRDVMKSHVALLGENVPKHLSVRIDLVALHRDKELWGEDALEFKPERFAQGVARACKHVYAYAPFGAGPRACIAQAFATTEVILVLALLVQRFSLRLSPSYRHEPVFRINLTAKFGVQVVLERVDDRAH